VSPFLGKASLDGLVVGNPTGFKTPSAGRIGRVRMSVELKSLLKKPIKFREIVVNDLEVTFEKEKGGSTLARIEDHVKSYEPPARGKPMKIEIRRFIVTGAKVRLSDKLLNGKAVTLSLADIELLDIGRSSGGVTVKQAVAQIVHAIDSEASKAATSGLKKGGRAVEKAGKSAVHGASQAIKSIFGPKK
jgi:uncharacterized protein involved in outer membrane biogenesis